MIFEWNTNSSKSPAVVCSIMSVKVKSNVYWEKKTGFTSDWGGVWFFLILELFSALSCRTTAQERWSLMRCFMPYRGAWLVWLNRLKSLELMKFSSPGSLSPSWFIPPSSALPLTRSLRYLNLILSLVLSVLRVIKELNWRVNCRDWKKN